MENLTKHLGVVGLEASGINPQPGYHLVVFRASGKGRVFQFLLLPGEHPPPQNQKWINRIFWGDSDFVSIPVMAGRSLRHEFSDEVKHASPGHLFEVQYVLMFRVDSPKIVAARWAEDPVRLTAHEINRVLSSPIRILNWTDLRLAIVIEEAATICREKVLDVIDELRLFGKEYGLNVEDIRLRLRLSQQDAQPETDAVDLGRRKAAIAIEAEKRRIEMAAEHELAVLRESQKAELSHLERRERLYDAGLESAINALRNIAAHTHRSEDLVRAVRELTSVIRPGIHDDSLSTKIGDTAETSVAKALDAVAVEKHQDKEQEIDESATSAATADKPAIRD